VERSDTHHTRRVGEVSPSDGFSQGLYPSDGQTFCGEFVGRVERSDTHHTSPGRGRAAKRWGSQKLNRSRAGNALLAQRPWHRLDQAVVSNGRLRGIVGTLRSRQWLRGRAAMIAVHRNPDRTRLGADSECEQRHGCRFAHPGFGSGRRTNYFRGVPAGIALAPEPAGVRWSRTTDFAGS
jgi:hypothetical protein